MVELSLNNEALKRDHFTDWKIIQCKTNKQIITLVAQYRDDISPSRLYCVTHLQLMKILECALKISTLGKLTTLLLYPSTQYRPSCTGDRSLPKQSLGGSRPLLLLLLLLL